MSSQAEYMVGWRDTTIHDFLQEIHQPARSMAYALITCLDSTFDMEVLLEQSKHMAKLAGRPKFVGRGLLVSTRQLLACESHDRLFFGFDEVWFFSKSSVTPKPEGLVIVGPERIDPKDIEKHGDWMRSNNCTLGFGDGIGLNYCLRVRGIAKDIVTGLNETAFSSSNVVLNAPQGHESEILSRS
jgi:hypothetical protein